MSIPLDLEIQPSDDYRKRITDILRKIGSFISGRDNGVSLPDEAEIQQYAKSLLNMSVTVEKLEVFPNTFELEISFEFVTVKCKFNR